MSNAQIGDLVVDYRSGWLCILTDTSVLHQEPFGTSEIYDVGVSLRPVAGKPVKLTTYRVVGISLADLLKLAEQQGVDFSNRPLEPELTESQKQAAVIEKLVQEVAALKAAQAKS